MRDLKKTPVEDIAFEDIAKTVTNKLEERAIAERTKLQRADHQKQLLDSLGKKDGNNNRKGNLAKENEEDPTKTKKEKKEKHIMTSEEKKEKRK